MARSIDETPSPREEVEERSEEALMTMEEVAERMTNTIDETISTMDEVVLVLRGFSKFLFNMSSLYFYMA